MNTLCKVGGMLTLAFLLSGCWQEQVYTDTELLRRATIACEGKGGVYRWGWESDYGSVKCYQNQEVVNLWELVEDKK